MFRTPIIALLLCLPALSVNAAESSTQLKPAQKLVKPLPSQTVEESETASQPSVKPVPKPGKRVLPATPTDTHSKPAIKPGRAMPPAKIRPITPPGSRLNPNSQSKPTLQRVKPTLPTKSRLLIPSSSQQAQDTDASPDTDTTTGTGSDSSPDTETTTETESTPQTPPPVVITTATWQLNNCQYSASITVRNDSSSSYSNLMVGIKQKAPSYSSWHGGGAVLISSLAPGQTVTKNLGWTRDLRATEFFAYVNETELIELDRETLNVGSINASIGQIQFSGSGAQAQWQAEVDNQSTTPICGGVTIIRKRLTGGGMDFAASNTSGLTLTPGVNTLSGSWDATNASHFNLRFGADSGAARGQGFWTLDEKEVVYTP